MDMKISNAVKTYEVYRNGKAAAQNNNRMSRAEEKKDMVDISSHAKDYNTASKAMANTPDIRADKVAALKAKFDANEYNVSGADVAEKIFSRLK